MNSCIYILSGELSTSCHHFEYRPLVMTRGQRADMFLILCPILFKLSLVVLNRGDFIIKVNLIDASGFP